MKLLVIELSDAEAESLGMAGVLEKLSEMGSVKGGSGEKRRQPYTVAECVELLGVSSDTVYSKMAAGIWSCVPDTGRRLMPVSEMDRLLGVDGGEV